jgi:hypothetical protein
VARLLDFEHVRTGGLHWHVMHASDSDVIEPLWRGLWELDYGDKPALNPFLRFGINNGDGEWLAVWRALAWSMTEGTTRVGLPSYYRDEAARNLRTDPQEATLVPWQYEMDLQKSPFTQATKGFVPARAAVPIRPAATEWQHKHERFAGLFELATFEDLTQLELAVGFDATSEISIFGTVAGDAQSVGSRLKSDNRPVLRKVLLEGDVFADLSLTRDRFPGTHSYLSFASHQDLTNPLRERATHFDAQWSTYSHEYRELTTLEEFAEAAERLLRLPGS